MTAKLEKSSLDNFWHSSYREYVAYFKYEKEYANNVRKQFRHSIYGMNTNNKMLDKTSKEVQYV